MLHVVCGLSIVHFYPLFSLKTPKSPSLPACGVCADNVLSLPEHSPLMTLCVWIGIYNICDW